MRGSILGFIKCPGNRASALAFFAAKVTAANYNNRSRHGVNVAIGEMRISLTFIFLSARRRALKETAVLALPSSPASWGPHFGGVKKLK